MNNFAVGAGGQPPPQQGIGGSIPVQQNSMYPNNAAGGSDSRPGSSNGLPSMAPSQVALQQQRGNAGTAVASSTTAAGPQRKTTATQKEKKSGTGTNSSKPKEKKSRSRLACLACKSTKQKCDGPSRVPCRRCELYGLECKFPPSAGVVRPTHTPGAVAEGGSNSPAVTQKLYEISARLHSIENALNITTTFGDDTSPQHHPAPSTPSHARSASNASESDDEMDQGDDDTKTKAATFNAMSQINISIDAIKGNQPRGQPVGEDYGAPDVIRRGVLTPEECQELFEFFFSSIHPWVMMLSITEDRNAMGVRSRSSLLFHTILVLSTSYSTPFPSQLHTTLVTFVNNIIAPQILSPQPHELTTDFLRALDLLNIYKMTQFATRRAEGLDIAEATRASKINGLASWMMQGILARTAERLELASVVGKFARAYSASAQGTAISQDIIRDLRLYYWLLSNDVHGNVQSGRRCNMEGAAALTTTRLFSSLQLQPYDTRLAASVEMFEIARPILRSSSYERTRRIARPDLERYNQGMGAWEEFWIPILLRQLAVDPLALSVMCPFAWFIQVQFNAAGYISYKRNRYYATDSDSGQGAAAATGVDVKPRKMRGDGARGLTQWEFESLQRSVRAAEGLVFTLSEESRIPGAWRAIQWEEAERSDGYRKLVLDDVQVNLSQGAMDAITCIAYFYPLVFLCKLVNEGLLTADLVLLNTPSVQPAWSYTQKLPRLLELGAAFLDAVSLNDAHPARTQADVLRSLLETGVKGGPPSSPQLPRHAATVMSPSPTAAPLYPIDPQQHQPHQQPQIPQQQQQWRNHNIGPSSNGGPIAPTAALLQYQQQGQQSNVANDIDMTRRSSMGTAGMDQALSSVLVGFDPLFGDNGNNAFWEWGQLGGGNGASGPADVGWGSGPL